MDFDSIKSLIHYLSLSLVLFSFKSTVEAQVYLRADGLTNTYDLIRSVYGPNALLLPDCKHSVPHISQENDTELGRPVFLFHAHVNEDDDRCVVFDRQRTEIGPDEGLLTVFEFESVSYSWNMKIDKDFQASHIWTHIGQIKAAGGNVTHSMPIMTLQAIKKDGFPYDLLAVTHTDSVSNTSYNGTFLATANLDEFRGTWVHIYQEATFGWNGSYHITITRVSDGQVILTATEPEIEMWRYGDGTTIIARPQVGIYRSLNDKNYLRDEIVKFDNFCIGVRGENCPKTFD